MAGNNNGRLTNAIGESLSPAAIKLTVPAKEVPELRRWAAGIALFLGKRGTANRGFCITGMSGIFVEAGSRRSGFLCTGGGLGAPRGRVNGSERDLFGFVKLTGLTPKSR